jgi:exonuclease III
MTQGHFVEFKHWLQRQNIDLVILSETRWSFTSCWSDDKWAYVNSSTEEPKTGGILVMISKKWALPDHIGFHVELPWRILHVRVHGHNRSTDVIALYQFEDQRTKQTTDNRHRYWNHLQSCLERMPNRNQLICNGDFNCALPRKVPWCGSSGFRWKGQRHFGFQHRDAEMLQKLMADHALVALNTWNESAGPTYQHGDFASRIDYIMIRHSTCDGRAKQVAHLPDAEFITINSTHHIPIIGSIRKIPVQYQTARAPRACTLAQRAQCRLAQLQDHDDWRALTDAIIDAVEQVPVMDSEKAIRNLHDQVIPDFHRLFTDKTARLPPIDYTALHETTRNKWHHHRCIARLRQEDSRSLQVLFQVWLHWSQYSRRQRTQQKQARIARAQRLSDLCQAVGEAATKHDAHGMFKIINQFTPKKPVTKIRLRTDDGQIADQYATHAMLIAFVQRTWQGPRNLPKFYESAPGVPFTVDDISRAV